MRSKLTGYDVGALLYCPANAHGSIVGAIVEQRFPTPYSLAFCLEDTVREDAVADAERMLRGTLSRIASASFRILRSVKINSTSIAIARTVM